jgi:hypothetical protein
MVALASIAMFDLMSGSSDTKVGDTALNRLKTLVDEEDTAVALAAYAITAGRTNLMRGRITEAGEQFQAALTAARNGGEEASESVVLNHLGMVELLSGNASAATSLFQEQLLLSSDLGHDEGVAWALEGLFASAAAAGDLVRAGRLLGGADTIRDRKGLYASAAHSFHQVFLQQLQSGPAARSFEEARAEGRNADLSEIVKEALA